VSTTKRGAGQVGSAADLARAAIVVAHPDDEIIWFSSLVTKVARVVMCYGTISANSERATNRKNAVKDYPRDVEFLDLPIPGRAAADMEAVHCGVLIDRLRTVLRGITTVFTHNPWGEYGQSDHQRVHAAVESLRTDMSFNIYVSCYVARHRLFEVGEALNRGVRDVISLPTSGTEINRVIEVYKLHSCWTWTPTWTWPKREHFLSLGDSTHWGGPAEIPVHLFGSRRKSRAEMRQLLRRLLRVRTTEVSLANPRYLSRQSRNQTG
jgi:LmbE family N-acetylglucosaminyl deacetylase